ncbi:hypothetical protein TRFO_15300 [Tritrichomonas foetus]|uniref:Uncharacterized protein n=1 Tax=Tritrichomonas foetus TaxID=1144522 RepID=A0A1J4KXE3_9EUKA|nr:hypothetical protein TRFO_15300 [Tritrichomonas foetus]|eukprot:OHT14372.1 hypothetical protein TRFO_15300 [Tritrichomonas foetus]
MNEKSFYDEIAFLDPLNSDGPLTTSQSDIALLMKTSQPPPDSADDNIPTAKVKLTSQTDANKHKYMNNHQSTSNFDDFYPKIQVGHTNFIETDSNQKSLINDHNDKIFDSICDLCGNNSNFSINRKICSNNRFDGDFGQKNGNINNCGNIDRQDNETFPPSIHFLNDGKKADLKRDGYNNSYREKSDNFSHIQKTKQINDGNDTKEPFPSITKNRSIECKLSLLAGDGFETIAPPRSISFNVVRKNGEKTQYRSFHSGRFSITLSSHSDLSCNENIHDKKKPIEKIDSLEKVSKNEKKIEKSKSGDLFFENDMGKDASSLNRIVNEIQKNVGKMNSFDELIDIF